ncbi:histidine phosphatase family protein [Ferrovibrio sp.]|uniref:histidine phosphatase family protein n=1 Tax=Ferrovibrio sp. TaxID=1917215 RepID=UPI0025C4E6F4|nr:histidine phosphatase family protein [Ferrovibrio sp.]MBX3454738.1 histidine phosphatase family protein [Ferrovibrio sp.]
MAKLYLVRHAKAQAGFSEAEDPGLSEEGRDQAVDLALRLEDLGPLPIQTSPLKRAQETAAPLANRWGETPEVTAMVAELPTPPDIAAQGLAARGPWLQRIASQRYADQAGILRAWRQGIIGSLQSCRIDMVIVTHFMVINAALGAAMGDDRLVIMQPDYCSVTVFENASGSLALVQRGAEASTRIL